MKFRSLRILFTISLIFYLAESVSAQDNLAIDYNLHDNKGKFFIFWGWNVSTYTESDISFRGNGYDFVLSNVLATDRQSPWDPAVYLNPALITIPQTNFKAGYYISDHYEISVGVDHMKYVMVQDQTVRMNGSINIEGSGYNGVYEDVDMLLDEDFLTFEHTDGLNYLNIELSRVDDILKWMHKGKKNIEINLIEGVGIGAVMPKTNAKLMSNERHDDFHFAGYGMNAKIGLNITFFRNFFVQGELKGGFIHMPDIRTTNFKSDKASQAFMYGEADVIFGAKFRLFKKKEQVTN